MSHWCSHKNCHYYTPQTSSEQQKWYADFKNKNEIPNFEENSLLLYVDMDSHYLLRIEVVIDLMLSLST